MEKVIFTEQFVKDDNGFYSCIASFSHRDDVLLLKAVNRYIKGVFEREDSYRFTGIIEINIPEESVSEENRDSFNHMIGETINAPDNLENIKTWIDTTEKEVYITYKIGKEIVSTFSFSERSVNKIFHARKNNTKRKGPGCLISIFRFCYYLFFYGIGFTLFLWGILNIQEGKMNFGIRCISISFTLFAMPSTIHFIIQKMKNTHR